MLVSGVLVADAPALAAIVEAVDGAHLVAFDLEFDTKDRLVPALCLVQVACVHEPLDAGTDPFVSLVDPLAVDISPLVAALAAHGTVVAHAPRQDLAILAARFSGVTFPGLVDTQLMAAFAGIGDQVGLAALASELVDVTLDKEQQWTAWSRRPLTDAQLRYAADDVRYLPRIYAKLASRLGSRVAWARAETAQIGATALASVRGSPEDAWRNVGGVRHLAPAQMAALAALAAWRHRTAVAHDRPLPQVLPDKVLVELARTRPDVDELRAIRGLPELARKDVEAIAEAIAAAPPLHVERHHAPSMRAQRWAELLYAIANLVADETGVAARLLATRADAEAVARITDEHGVGSAHHLPAFSTWRRDILGSIWERWLSGHVALVSDPTTPHGIRLVPTT